MTEGFDGFDVLTGGFCFEGCIINDRRFCLLKTLLVRKFPLPSAASHSSVYKWVSVFYINQKEKT